ncbi:MAG: TatD family hydrolase [Alistipes sp.]|nr:TatD family hydrolase [Alistipes sp.]
MVSYRLGREIVPERPGGPFSAGIHPWDTVVLTSDRQARGLSYIETAPIAAVGEAGLDRTKGADMERQAAIFIEQIEIATNRRLPVVVHCVKAYNELFAVVEKYPHTVFILHGYIGSPEQTRRALDSGCFFSIGETSLGSGKTVESIKSIPRERLFAETDESSADIADIYGRLAEIKEIQISDLKSIMEINFNRIFRKNI